MNKILLWIGISGGLWVPLHAASNGHNKKALVVAGYVRKNSPRYIPPNLLDGIYRYWAAGQRTKIGDAFRWKSPEQFDPRDHCAFVPPSTLLTLYVDHLKHPLSYCLIVSDLQDAKDDTKRPTIPLGQEKPTAIWYVPYGNKGSVVLGYDTFTLQKLSLFDLEKRHNTFFDGTTALYCKKLLVAPDSQGFVSMAGDTTIEALAYWDIRQYKLTIRYALPTNLLGENSVASFLDTDRFALLGSYEDLRKGTYLYMYHRKKKDLLRKVHVKMPPSFDAYHFKASCWMKNWIIVPVSKGFWMYHVLDTKQYCTSYPWGHEKPYKMFPLGESQLVWITKLTKNKGARFKAAIGEMEEVGPSIHVTTWERKVLDENVYYAWKEDYSTDNYSLLVLLGSSFMLKVYHCCGRDMVVHSFT